MLSDTSSSQPASCPAAATGLAAIGKLQRLRTLNLWNCLRISEQGLAALTLQVGKLTDLSLRGCQQLSDDVTPALASLQHLQRLDLRACERFTGVLHLNAQPWMTRLHRMSEQLHAAADVVASRLEPVPETVPGALHGIRVRVFMLFWMWNAHQRSPCPVKSCSLLQLLCSRSGTLRDLQHKQQSRFSGKSQESAG